MEKSNQASIDASPYWRLVGCTLHGTTWKCTHAKNYINYTVMLLFESPSGTILKKDLEFQGLFFRLQKSVNLSERACKAPRKQAAASSPMRSCNGDQNPVRRLIGRRCLIHKPSTWRNCAVERYQPY